MNLKKLKQKDKNTKIQIKNVLLLRKKININNIQSHLIKNKELNKYLSKDFNVTILKPYLFGQLF